MEDQNLHYQHFLQRAIECVICTEINMDTDYYLITINTT